MTGGELGLVGGLLMLEQGTELLRTADGGGQMPPSLACAGAW